MRPVPSVALLGALTLAPALLLSAPAPEPPTRARMLQIYAALRTLIPLSLSEDRFADPGSRETISGALEAMAATAEELGAHGQANAPGMASIGSYLAGDARRARDRFLAGEHRQARFLTRKLTEACFACHSQRPVAGDFTGGKRFLDVTGAGDLPLEDQVSLAVATRQFDHALELAEKTLASPTLSPARLDRQGVLEGYLKICVRVERDLERAAHGLQKLRRRPGVPVYLATYLETWIESLQEITPHLESAPSLATARGLVARGYALSEYPEDRSGWIHFLAASSLLHEFVDDNPEDPEELAEAYYLMGMTEDHVSRATWILETEVYLEAAIRTLPGSEIARDAYRYLEESLIEGYTGTAGTRMPAHVEAHLQELWRLANASRN